MVPGSRPVCKLLDLIGSNTQYRLCVAPCLRRPHHSPRKAALIILVLFVRVYPKRTGKYRREKPTWGIVVRPFLLKIGRKRTNLVSLTVSILCLIWLFRIQKRSEECIGTISSQYDTVLVLVVYCLIFLYYCTRSKDERYRPTRTVTRSSPSLPFHALVKRVRRMAHTKRHQ